MRHAVLVNWRELVLAAAILIVVAGGVVFWVRRRPRDPAEVERQRRSHLNQIGRIVEGQILEIAEAPADDSSPRRGIFGRRSASAGNGGSRTRKLLIYTYSTSGVTYETAQDITGMEEHACIERLVAGQPASVKYDPSNPSNSILIADDWSGLH